MSEKVTIVFQDKADVAFFHRYIKKAKSQDGTVGGLYAGLLCSALKRCQVTTPVQIETAASLLKKLKP